MGTFCIYVSDNWRETSVERIIYHLKKLLVQLTFKNDN